MIVIDRRGGKRCQRPKKPQSSTPIPIWEQAERLLALIFCHFHDAPERTPSSVLSALLTSYGADEPGRDATAADREGGAV